MIKVLYIGVFALLAGGAWAQSKVDDARMDRDVQIAENVLSTMLKQQFSKRSFFPLEVNGKYMPGFGVTFRVPSENFGFLVTPDYNLERVNVMDGSGFSISLSHSDEMPEPPEAPEAPELAEIAEDRQAAAPARSATRVKTKQEAKTSSQSVTQNKNNSYTYKQEGYYGQKSKKGYTKNTKDSLRTAYNQRIIDAAKDFIADYGDILTQLGPNEKIIITNRGEGQYAGWMSFNNDSKRSFLSIEGTKGDVTQFRQGKLTRDQLMAKIKVVNSVTDDELKPDLELLSSMFSRLYSRDLSKTFFSDNNVYYERLKDYGVIYNMQVYSSNAVNGENDLFIMPTVNREEEVDTETRNNKVKELYPLFEKGLKEDILEYGHTLKSLKDDESLVFNVQVTRCQGCEIPSTLELSIKMSALKDYTVGKLSKDAAMAAFTVKKGPNQ